MRKIMCKHAKHDMRISCLKTNNFQAIVAINIYDEGRAREIRIDPLY